jgi:hypothetical protein
MKQIVDGEGVIGKTCFKTESSTPIVPAVYSSSRVFGTFNMVNFTSTRNFKVAIPTNLAVFCFELRFTFKIFNFLPAYLSLLNNPLYFCYALNFSQNRNLNL